MRNFSLPPAGTLHMPVSNYSLMINYDAKGNRVVYKIELELDKISLSSDILKNVMNSKVLNDLDLRMLFYIIYKLEKDSDEVTLNPKIIMRYLDWKSSSISNSISKLCQEGYIKPITGKGNGRCKYQVNISYFFFGKRIEFLENIDPKLTNRKR